eukprot:128536-Amphidinium_carterae.1
MPTELRMEGPDEQGPKARSLPQPVKRPSEESVREHRQTHLPHAPWCEICREARMKEGPHRPVERDDLGNGPIEVQLDYMFETHGDIMVTILTMRWPMSGWCNATVVPSKGPVQWAVEWTLRSLRAAGQQRFLLKTDAEPAIESLANAVVSRLDNESTVRAAPRGSHSSIGVIERWHQDLRGQVKALASELSLRLGGREIEVGSPVRAWLIRHSAWLLARFQQYKGETPHSRIFGHEYRHGLASFGERVQAVDPEPASKTSSRVFVGYWLGKAEGSDEHFIALESGIIQKFRTVRRVEEEGSWDPQ